MIDKKTNDYSKMGFQKRIVKPQFLDFLRNG